MDTRVLSQSLLVGNEMEIEKPLVVSIPNLLGQDLEVMIGI